ncbi:MAG: hypothetical protein QOD81_2835 [Solirubrobacteraceae bacterium]|jgi:hypothetical protein|nr:hypothetical protein [Solirubrobacteraceae bacterium]
MERLISVLTARRRRTKTVGLTGVIVLAIGAIAVAAPNGLLNPGSGGPQGVVAVGPVSPTHGFPDWYRDTNGTDLAPCLDPQDPYCGGAVAAPDNTAPITFPDNFPDEFFYQAADAANLTSAGGEKVLASFALEGAFANGPVTQGDQIVFSRIRYRINAGLKPDTDYKVTHPYGTDTVRTDPGANGFFVTQDVGVTPGDFSQALKGRVGPFLQWAPNAADATDVPPVGYVGDGVTPHKVQGSELGTNFVRIEGPGIGGAAGAVNPNPCRTSGANAYSGPVNDCIETDQFTLVGKKSTNAGVDVTRATYERGATGAGAKIQVLAGSKALEDIVVQDGDNGPGPGRLIPTTPLRGDAGRYLARVDVAGALPAYVDVINRGDVPQTTKHVKLTDAVTGTAVYHVTSSGKDTLHVAASSSDKALSPTEITLPQLKTALGTDGQADIATAAPPESVTISSSKGGSVTVPVAIDGEGLAALPLLADAGPDITVEQGTTVTLNGGGSSGNIDSFSWNAPSDVTLTGADRAKATFTAPARETTLAFQLTVTGNGETKTDEVLVKVKPVNPAKAVIAPVGATVLQNLPITLDASGSDGAARFEWSQVSGTPVTLDNPNVARPTFLFPKTTTPITMRVRVRSSADQTATGGACAAPACDAATITLTPEPDLLLNIRAKNDGKGRWVVDGTSSVLVSNNVRVHAGATNAGALIGTGLVDPTGAWKVDVRNSQVAVPACRCVSVESDRGGSQLNIPLG